MTVGVVCVVGGGRCGVTEVKARHGLTGWGRGVWVGWVGEGGWMERGGGGRTCKMGGGGGVEKMGRGVWRGGGG